MPINVDKSSTFISSNLNIENEELNLIFNEFKELLTNTSQIDTGNQFILTESDLKCIVYKTFFNIVDKSPCKIFTELADKETDLTKKTIKTDITISLPSDIYYRNTNIQKGFTVNGIHADIELKYIRKGLKKEQKKEVIQDLVKLYKLIKKGSIKKHGETIFGLVIFGFQKEDTLKKYLEDKIFRKAIKDYSSEKLKFLFLYH